MLCSTDVFVVNLKIKFYVCRMSQGKPSKNLGCNNYLKNLASSFKLIRIMLIIQLVLVSWYFFVFYQTCQTGPSSLLSGNMYDETYMNEIIKKSVPGTVIASPIYSTK